MSPAEVCAPLPQLRGLAISLVGRDRADDLLQDTAERAIRHCGRADPAHLRGWLSSIMWRHGLFLHRTERAARSVMRRWPPIAPVVPPEGEAACLLRECCDRLTDSQRRALGRFAAGDGPLTGCEKRRIHEARQRLRGALS